MESKNIRYYLDTTKVQRHETLAGTIVLVSIIEFQNDDFETILSKIYFVTTKLLLRAKEPSRSIYPEILNIDMSHSLLVNNNNKQIARTSLKAR